MKKGVSSNNFSHGVARLANRKVAISADSQNTILKFHVLPQREEHMKKQWEVRWVESIPTDENGDADLDRAKCAHRRFGTEKEARDFAPQAAGESYWGCAQIAPIAPVTRGDVEDEDWPYAWWIEKGRLMGYVGECEEVEA